MIGDAGNEEEALGKAYDTRLIRWLWQYVKPYWAMVVFSILVVIPIFFLELAPAWIVKHGLDAIVVEKGMIDKGPPGSDILDQIVSPGIIESFLTAPEGMGTWVYLAIVYALV